MRIVTIFLIALFPLFSTFSIPPISEKIGLIETGALDENARLALAASQREPSVEWFEEYAGGDVMLTSTYLSSIMEKLPLENAVLSKSGENVYNVLSLESGDAVTFYIEDGKIAALRFF